MRRDLEKDVVGAVQGRRRQELEERDARRSGDTRRGRSSLRARSDARSPRSNGAGKYLLLTLDSGDVLVVHFGMSGRFQRRDRPSAMPAHTHVVMTFQQGGDLRYIDPRTFGELFVSAADDLGKVKELQHLAIDPLDQVFTWPTFQYLLADRAAKMKPLMMDQKFISGLGNIYSDEVLFARGHPVRPHVQHAVIARGAPALSSDPGGAAGSHQASRHDAGRRGLRRSVRSSLGSTATSSKVYGRTGPAVPALPHGDPEREDQSAYRRSIARSARASLHQSSQARQGSLFVPGELVVWARRRSPEDAVVRSPTTRRGADPTLRCPMRR